MTEARASELPSSMISAMRNPRALFARRGLSVSFPTVAASGVLTALAVGLTVACGGGVPTDDNGDKLPPGPLRWVDAEPGWSPDGRRIIFTRGSLDPLADDFNLRWVDVRNGRERALTRGIGHRDRDPAWSPDGRSIVFVRSFDSDFCDANDGIYTIRPDGSRLRDLKYRGCDPAWSPKGSRLAFLTSGWEALIVVSAATGLPRRIAGGGSIYSYDWSPDGSKLVFERDNEIWVVAVNGGAVRRLTRKGYTRVAHGPLWSPDGSLILPDRYIGGEEGLWVMRPDGEEARKIVDGETGWEAWSPDGARIAFARDGGLFTVDRDGNDERRLPGLSGGSEGGWSPDGTRIAGGGETRGTLSPDPYPIVVVDVETERVIRATQRPSSQ